MARAAHAAVLGGGGRYASKPCVRAPARGPAPGNGLAGYIKPMRTRARRAWVEGRRESRAIAAEVASVKHRPSGTSARAHTNEKHNFMDRMRGARGHDDVCWPLPAL